MKSAADRAKRTETVSQLQRQLEAAVRLCGVQLEIIRKLKRENERLRLRLAAVASDGGGGIEGVNLYELHTLDRRIIKLSRRQSIGM